MFKLRSSKDDVKYEKVRIASQAYAIGDAVMLDRTSDAIDVVPATASSTTANVYGIAMQTVTSSATELLVAVVAKDQEWEADLANNSNSAHNRQRMIFTDADTVNNTGTDVSGTTGVIEQINPIGAAAEKKALIRFLV